MKEASALVNGKRCPECNTELSAKDVGWTGDRYGWELDGERFPMTAIVYCPKKGCKQLGMGQLGIEKPTKKPKYFM